MTLAEWYAEVRKRLGHPDTGGPSDYSNTVLGAHYEELTREWALEMHPEFLIVPDTVNQTNGTATYDGPAKAIFILKILPTYSSALVSTKPANRMTLQVIGGPTWESASAGRPTHWYPVKPTTANLMRFGLWPAPNSTVSNGIQVLNVNRPANVSEISSGSIPDWPVEVQEALADEAAARIATNATEVPDGLDVPALVTRAAAGKLLCWKKFGTKELPAAPTPPPQ